MTNENITWKEEYNKYPIYKVYETGLGHWTDTTSDEKNADKIDIQEAREILEEIGTGIECTEFERDVKYYMIYDYTKKQGIPGLYIPSIIYDYLNNILTKIYFAHSMAEYNTEYEKMCIETIKEIYKNHIIKIINPKDINKEESEVDKLKKTYKGESFTRNEFHDAIDKDMIKFYKEIDKCDIICAFPHSKRSSHLLGRNIYTLGVQKEIEYSQKTNKELHLFEINDGKLKERRDKSEF